MSAPRISALCHPYELAADEGEVASLMVYKATRSERTSLRISLTQIPIGNNILEHMERIRYERQRTDRVADNQFLAVSAETRII